MTDTARPVFIAGEEKYTCFRIPAIIKLKNDVLLALLKEEKMAAQTPEIMTWS